MRVRVRVRLCVPTARAPSPQAYNIQKLFPAAEMVELHNASHCPHDDAPKETNAALLTWLEGLPAGS